MARSVQRRPSVARHGRLAASGEHGLPHLSALRGHLRPRARRSRATRSSRSAATRTTSSPTGYICPKGIALKELHEDPDRLRTPLVRHRDGEFATRPGTRRSPRSTGAPAADPRAARPRRGRRLPRQPDRPQPRRRCSTAASSCKALGTRNVFTGEHGRPDAQAGRRRRCCSATSLTHPDPRRRPHRLPADARRQPARLERQPDDRARHAPGGSRRIRERGGKVVVVDPRRTRDRRGRRRARCHPPRHRRPAAARDGRTCSSTRGWRRPRPRSASSSTGCEAVERRSRATSRPRRSRRSTGIDAGRDPRASPRELAGAPTRRGLRPHRHLHAGVRHARELARRRAQHPHRQPRPRRAARCSRAAAAGARNTDGRARPGTRRHDRALDAAGCAACPRCAASCPSPCLAEEIETPGDGQIRALVTVGGNPVLSTPEQRAGSTRRSTRSTSWCRSTSTSTRRRATPT